MLAGASCGHHWHSVMCIYQSDVTSLVWVSRIVACQGELKIDTEHVKIYHTELRFFIQFASNNMNMLFLLLAPHIVAFWQCSNVISIVTFHHFVLCAGHAIRSPVIYSLGFQKRYLACNIFVLWVVMSLYYVSLKLKDMSHECTKN